MRRTFKASAIMSVALLVILAGLWMMAAHSTASTFDESERKCQVADTSGNTVDICPAANTEQVLVEAELTEGDHAITGPLGITIDEQLTEQAYVVCFSDSGTMFGVVSSVSTGVTPQFTTGQIDGENFLPVAYMPTDSLVNPTQVQEQLKESVQKHHDTDDISCQNPLLAVSTEEKDQLETIRQ